MKVYLVSTGDYSDYGIRAVCSTREKAESLVRKMREEHRYDDVNDIEEMELDEPCSRVERGLSTFRVCWRRDFETIHVFKDGVEHEPHGIKGNYPGPCFISVEARDEDHAKKIALEKWIIHKASI